MPITDDSTLIAALKGASGNRLILKASQASKGAGTYHSMWKAVGSPVAGSNPPLFSAGAGYVPSAAILGCFPFVAGATNNERALCKLSPIMGFSGVIIPYDRLWACSGFNTTLLTAQGVAAPGALPVGRDPNLGSDVLPFGEVYTAPGAIAATWTLTGTDAAGNANRTWIYSHPANAESVGQMFLFLPGGASPSATAGIRQVISLTCNISSGLAGDVGITLCRLMSPASSPLANQGPTLDALATGLPTVYNDSCVAFMMLCTTTATGLLMGEMVIA